MYDMKLTDTIQMMSSEDYKERFKAEYKQLEIRLQGLNSMVSKWDNNNLSFTPVCPRELYDIQLKSMTDHLNVLTARAVIEGIEV